VKKLIAFSVVAAVLVGCASNPYVMHRSPAVQLKAQDRIVVASSDPNLQLALENSLLNRGLFVKTTEIESALSTTLQEETSVEQYGFLNSLTNAISSGGKINGAEKVLKELKEWNDLKDELIRVDDYSKVIVARQAAMKKVYEVYGVDYILAVAKSGNYGYRARLVSVRDNRLAYTFYFEASTIREFNKLVPKADTRPNVKSGGLGGAQVLPPNSQVNMIRVSEYLLDNMLK
jgi:hypothetical protein